MSLKEKTIFGFIWTLIQQLSTQGIAFINSIILARLLEPKDFGLIGMIAIFITIAKVLMDSGLTSSLIRSKDPDQEDYSSVFVINLIGSVVMYLLLFMLAPLIANFFNQKILVDIIRVYSLVIIIQAFSAVQLTKLTKEMNFKTQLTISIPSLILSGALGIILALYEFGVWSLVYMQLSSALFLSIQLWVRINWKPSLNINIEKLKYHFNFGYKLAIASIINSIFDNIYNIIIGKLYTPALLGYYTRAQGVRKLPMDSIATTINKVTYPLFAAINNENSKLKDVYSKLMQQVLYWVMPLMIVLGIIAEPLFRILFTEKWLPAVPYFHILCIAGIMYPLNKYNLNILNVKGRSDLFLKLEIIKKALVIMSLFLVIPFGIYGLVWGQVALSIIGFLINSSYSGKLLNYSTSKQIKDILPIVLISINTGIIVRLVDMQFITIPENDIIRLIIATLTAITLYFILSISFHINAFYDFIALVKSKK